MTPALLALALAAPPAVEIIGHRGASWDAPENTVASIKRAWAQGADAAEFDVYLSKDGQLVVLHDKSLNRTTGVDRPVTDLTAAEVGKLDAGRWKGTEFAGEPVPTLAAVLATVPASKRVFIEVKCGPEAVPELDRVVRASGLKPEQTAVIAFSADVVAAVKAARPDLKAYWLVSLAPKKGQEPPTAAALIAKAKAVRADGLDLSATPAVLTPAFAREVKAAGLGLYVWTVNDPAVARAMIAAGVAGVTTDRPGWLRDRLADGLKPLRVLSTTPLDLDPRGVLGPAVDAVGSGDRPEELLQRPANARQGQRAVGLPFFRGAGRPAARTSHARSRSRSRNP